MPEKIPKQVIWLAVIVALVVVVYGWVIFRPGPALEVDVLATPASTMFTFSGRVEFYEAKVTKLGGADEDDAIVWHMVPRDVEGARPVEAAVVTYGRRRGLGLRPAPGTRGRGEALVPGARYRFEADTSGGNAVVEFTMPGG